MSAQDVETNPAFDACREAIDYLVAQIKAMEPALAAWATSGLPMQLIHGDLVRHSTGAAGGRRGGRGGRSGSIGTRRAAPRHVSQSHAATRTGSVHAGVWGLLPYMTRMHSYTHACVGTPWHAAACLASLPALTTLTLSPPRVLPCMHAFMSRCSTTTT